MKHRNLYIPDEINASIEVECARTGKKFADRARYYLSLGFALEKRAKSLNFDSPEALLSSQNSYANYEKTDLACNTESLFLLRNLTKELYAESPEKAHMLLKKSQQEASGLLNKVFVKQTEEIT